MFRRSGGDIGGLTRVPYNVCLPLNWLSARGPAITWRGALLDPPAVLTALVALVEVDLSALEVASLFVANESVAAVLVAVARLDGEATPPTTTLGDEDWESSAPMSVGPPTVRELPFQSLGSLASAVA